MAAPKGHPKWGGRQKGTPNRAGLPWKQLMAEVCESEDFQKTLMAFLKERPAFIFKAAEFAFGKPNQSIEATVKSGWLLPKGDDVADD